MGRPPRPLDTLVADVVVALTSGKVVVPAPEAGIPTPYGCALPQTQARAISIEEAANLIDTLVHEAIHAARPEWSEHGVRVQAARLVNRLSRRDIERLYHLYLSGRPLRPPQGAESAATPPA